VSAGLWLLLAAVGAVLLIALRQPPTCNWHVGFCASVRLPFAPPSVLARWLDAIGADGELATRGLRRALGILLSFTGVRLFLSAAPANLPRLDEVQISWPCCFLRRVWPSRRRYCSALFRPCAQCTSILGPQFRPTQLV